jgi:hypothetical protein
MQVSASFFRATVGPLPLNKKKTSRQVGLSIEKRLEIFKDFQALAMI